MFVVVVLCAAICGWFTHCSRRQAIEAESIAVLTDRFGENFSFGFDYQYDKDGQKILLAKGDPPVEPKGPKLIRKLFGDHIFSRVTYASFINCELDDSVGLEILPQFRELEHLRLSEVRKLGSLRLLTSLRTLNVRDIENLQPEPGRLQPDLGNICDLKQLEVINISQPISDEAGNALSQLKNLQEIELYDCPDLTSLDWAIGMGRLRSLKIRSSPKIRSLKPLANCRRLEFLQLRVKRLDSFVPLKKLVDLRELHIDASKGPESLVGLELSKKLEVLQVSGARVTSFAPLQNLEQLKELRLSCRGKTKALHAISALQQLENLYLNGLTELDDLQVVGKLFQLKSLGLPGCAVANLEPIRNLKLLENIYLPDCLNLVNTEAVRELPNLAYVDFSGCELLTELDMFSKLTKLKRLDLSDCTGLTSLKPLRDLPSSPEVRIAGCSGLKTLDGWPSKPVVLNTVDLSGCTDLADLAALANAQKIWSLIIADCPSLRTFPALPGTSVIRLALSNCENLESFGDEPITALRAIKPINHLKIENCEKLKGLPRSARWAGPFYEVAVAGRNAVLILQGFSPNTEVTSLEIFNSPEITDLSATTGLREIENLTIENCASFVDFKRRAVHQDSDRPSPIKRLKINKCQSLAQLSDSIDLRGLTKLEVNGCHDLETVECLKHSNNVSKIKFTDCRRLRSIGHVSAHYLDLLQVHDANVLHRSNFSGLTGINNLYLDRADELGSLARYPVHKVYELKIEDCTGMTSLDGISALKKLHKLVLLNADELVSTRELSECDHLDSLTISNASQLNLVDLSEFPKLKFVDLNGCQNLPADSTVDQVASLEKLKELYLSGRAADSFFRQRERFGTLDSIGLDHCESITDAETLVPFNASKVVLKNCHSLRKIRQFCEQSNARNLTIEDCPLIGDIEAINRMRQLVTLTLRSVSQQQLDQLASFSSAPFLHIENCADLKVLKYHSHYGTVYLKNCPKLKRIDLPEGNKFDSLTIDNCPEIPVRHLDELKKQTTRNFHHTNLNLVPANVPK